MARDLSPAARAAVLEHVLDTVHPDRESAEVVGVAPAGDRLRVGVKAHPRGYLSTAKYALVTVDGERVVDAEACDGRRLRRALAGEG